MTEEKYYKLRVDKETFDIRLILMYNNDVMIQTAKEDGVNNKIYRYNDIFYFSLNTKLLKELGKQFKAEWIIELELKLKEIHKIKI